MFCFVMVYTLTFTTRDQLMRGKLQISENTSIGDATLAQGEPWRLMECSLHFLLITSLAILDDEPTRYDRDLWMFNNILPNGIKEKGIKS